MKKKFQVVLAALFAVLLVPAFAFADVEGGVGRQPFRIGRERAVEAMG